MATKRGDKIDHRGGSIAGWKHGGPGGGTPPIQYDWVAVEKLFALRCTLVEAAGVCRVHPYALAQACKRQYGMTYGELVDRFAADTKRDLREKQVSLALEGNPTMLIWLGKQMLGQRDQQDIEMTVAERPARSLTRDEVERELAQLSAPDVDVDAAKE